MGKRWTAIKAVVATTFGTPTNYGGGYMNGVWITFLRGSDGIVRICTPLALAGTPIVRDADGRWRFA